jgi:hypothetical protein
MWICTTIRCTDITKTEIFENLRKLREDERDLSMMREIDMTSRAVVNGR